METNNGDSSIPYRFARPENIRWYEETMTFDTFHEAYEWISSDALGKIGYDYEGYKTTDPKLAYELLFQLVRAKTLGTDSREVYADVEFSGNCVIYLVWVSRK